MDLPFSFTEPTDAETRRLRTLARYDVLNNAPTNAFDRITELAADLFDVPMAMVNFIDQDEQYCLSMQGIDLERAEREVSFCTHTIQTEGVMVVEDTHEDPRFVNNPLVTGAPHLRFYAGAPLRAPNDTHLGSLCILGDTPRTFSDEERDRLLKLADVVMDELHLHDRALDLNESRHLYRERSRQATQILESITDAFFALDTDWRFTYANEQAETFLETPRTELLGERVWDVFPEAVGSVFETQYRNALSEQQTVQFTAFYAPLNRWFEVKAFPFDEGLSVYFDDITARVEAEENLRRERDLTEAIIDTSIAAIIILAPDGTVSFSNERAEEILGIDLEGAHYQDTVDSLFPVDGDMEDERYPFQRVVDSGAAVSDTRYRIRTVDGAQKVLSINAAPLCDANGGIRQVVFSITDVTDAVERRKELVAAKEEAEKASRLKSSFLAHMSHDVRTPLSSIMSLTELLSMQAPEEMQDRLDMIERNSQRLLDTLDSVLDLSRLESGSVEMNVQPVNVVDEVCGSAELFQATAQEADVSLAVETDLDHLIVRLDPGMLHRITDNLVSNAIKFTDAGGQVTLTVSAPDSDRMVLTVEDTGVGISDDFLPDLFAAFTRNHAGSEGNGLGLAITKRLTELMGGKVRVRSTEGVGTTFFVHLPQDGGLLPELRGEA